MDVQGWLPNDLASRGVRTWQDIIQLLIPIK